MKDGDPCGGKNSKRSDKADGYSHCEVLKKTTAKIATQCPVAFKKLKKGAVNEG